jgi:methionyl-tRNA formyltransferase
MPDVIVFNRPWCRELPERLESKTGRNFLAIDNKEKLNREFLNIIQAENVFFPHWSYFIPEEVYNNFRCIIFHMTDLPFGRGGSPLQNLIVRGHKETKISAIQRVKEVDAGPVYLKKPLSLNGSAEEIFIRANRVIEQMIIEILETNPLPSPQQGDVVQFRRRIPEDGDWRSAVSLDAVYDHIRMLDAKGYPPAFIRVGDYKLEFSKATREAGSVHASVRIKKDKANE